MTRAILEAVKARLRGEVPYLKSVMVAPGPESIYSGELMVFPANLSFPAAVVCDAGILGIKYYPARQRRLTQSVAVHVLQKILNPEHAVLGVGTVKGVIDVSEDVDEALTFAPTTAAGLGIQNPALNVAGATSSVLVKADPAMEFALEDADVIWKRLVFEVVVFQTT